MSYVSRHNRFDAQNCECGSIMLDFVYVIRFLMLSAVIQYVHRY